jgi:hypothetical protein
MSHPTVTSISWQQYTADDMPAVTICPMPSYNPGKWADFFVSNFWRYVKLGVTVSHDLLSIVNC